MRRFPPASVRGKAVLSTAVAMTIFGLAIGLASFILVSQVARSSAHDVVTTRIGDVIEQIGDRGIGGADALDLGIVERTNPVYVQVMSAAGEVLATTPGLAPDARVCPSAVPGRTVRDSFAMTVNGVRTTFLREVRPTRDGQYAVCGVVSDEPMERVQSSVLLALLVVLPLVIAGVCLAVWLAVGRALGAVDDLRTQAESMERDSAATLRVQPTGDEVERLGRTLNSLLEDLHHQSATTRQFVADAGHELRNPLTTLRLSLEFGSEASGDELRASVHDALVDLTRLEVLVQDLLALARTDSIEQTAHFGEVDLSGVVLAAADGVRRSRPDVALSIDVESCNVLGDESALRSLVVNLLDNAARHSVSSVDVTLVPVGEDVVLRVDDDGAGLRPEDCERVFDRFVRLDEARHRDEGGSGLGLAIVDSVAKVHGGRVSATPGPGGHFEVHLPARRSARFTRA
jgi:signal transduction histidine kinase